MSSFGKRLKECREQKGLSQQELGGALQTTYSVIGKYERDEMKPSIDVAVKLANALGTTVGYLVGENVDSSILKDQSMLKRINDISSMNEEEQKEVLFCLDAGIHLIKFRRMMK